MTAETDIAAIDDSGANTASEVRTALTSVLARGSDTHVVAQMYRSSSQTLSNSVDDKIDFNAEDFDTDGSIVNTGSSRFDIQDTGYYRVDGYWAWENTRPGVNFRLTIYVNGSESRMGRGVASSIEAYGSASISAVISLTASDYVELYAYTDGASATARGHASNPHTRSYMTIQRIV